MRLGHVKRRYIFCNLFALSLYLPHATLTVRGVGRGGRVREQTPLAWTHGNAVNTHTHTHMQSCPLKRPTDKEKAVVSVCSSHASETDDQRVKHIRNIHVYIYMSIHTHTLIHTYIYIYLHTNVRIYIYIYIFTHIFIYLYNNVYIYMYNHPYKHIHTHLHT